jgi:hypothetical protein
MTGLDPADRVMGPAGGETQMPGAGDVTVIFEYVHALRFDNTIDPVELEVSVTLCAVPKV